MPTFKRQTSGSVVCPGCGRLVGVNDARCFECNRWNPGLWGWAPVLGRFGRDLGFTQIILIGCVIMYVITLLYDPSQIRLPTGGGLGALFGFLAPSTEPLFLFGGSGHRPVFLAGRWWTVLSAAWLHGSLLHIGMNMYYMRFFAPAVGRMYGAGRLVIIYTVSSAVGFGLTSIVGGIALPRLVAGAPFTVGASAPLFGLLGALVVYGQRSGDRGLLQRALQSILILMLVGFLAGLGIDNWAHIGGFAGGYFAARMLDPLRPESQGHLLAGLACLLLIVLSIVASFFHGLRFIG